MRLFLAHIVPKKEINNFHVAQASHNFSYNLIEAGIFDKVYSIMPPNVGGRKNTFVDSNYELIYSFLRKYRATQKIATVIENIKLFIKLNNGDKLWLYNVSRNNVILVKLLRLFKPGVKVYPIILDFSPDLKQCQDMLPIINQLDGMISLSTSPLFTIKNSECLAGVVPSGVPDHEKINTPINRDFLLSGNLKEQICMMSMLLPAFAKMPEYNLHITGRVEDNRFLEKYTSHYDNIIYHGLLSFDDYLSMLESFPFALSTRNPESPENQCNFPSKVIESLLYNRIIISTIEYPQLDGIKYFKVSSNVDGFVNDIKRICAMSDFELMNYANQSKRTCELFSTDRWNQVLTQIEYNTI